MMAMYHGSEHEQDPVSHEVAARMGVPVSGCKCDDCDRKMRAIWSRSLLDYCRNGSVDYR
jgi:hypothetical protein